MRFWLPVLTLAALTGCASLAAQHRTSQFDRLTQAYERAIGWSNFEVALTALPRSESLPRPDTASFKDIKVTSYVPVSSQVMDDGRTVKRLVRIGYVHTSDMVEHSVTTEEEWKYSDASEQWSLLRGFPQFK